MNRSYRHALNVFLMVCSLMAVHVAYADEQQSCALSETPIYKLVNSESQDQTLQLPSGKIKLQFNCTLKEKESIFIPIEVDFSIYKWTKTCVFFWDQGLPDSVMVRLHYWDVNDPSKSGVSYYDKEWMEVCVDRKALGMPTHMILKLELLSFDSVQIESELEVI